MKEVTHRQMRNDSAEVLRRVAAGETILVTNRGRPAAVIGPPPQDPWDDLETRGQLRPAVAPTASLLGISRSRTTRTSKEIIDDVRGPW